MDVQRREFVKVGGALGVMVAAGLLTAEEVRAQAARNKAFEGKTVEETVQLLGATTLAPSTEITITAPDIAENGAVVPVAVASKIPNTQALYILVEKNLNQLAAGFTIPAGTEPSVSTRVKMAQTSNVHAIVKADNKYFVATKEIKVTLGGCGG